MSKKLLSKTVAVSIKEFLKERLPKVFDRNDFKTYFNSPEYTADVEGLLNKVIEENDFLKSVTAEKSDEIKPYLFATAYKTGLERSMAFQKLRLSKLKWLPLGLLIFATSTGTFLIGRKTNWLPVSKQHSEISKENLPILDSQGEGTPTPKSGNTIASDKESAQKDKPRGVGRTADPRKTRTNDNQPAEESYVP